VARESARPRDKAPLEAHRRYIDVQYVLSGADEMGWRALSDCKSPGGYDAARDIEFFTDEPAAWATVSTGEFAIFFPHDAHAPLTGRGDIHKVVVKVAVADEVRA